MIAEDNQHVSKLIVPSRSERLVRWIAVDLRPVTGWGALLCAAALAWLPAEVARANRWLQGTTRSTFGIAAVGAVAVLITWFLFGWYADQQTVGHKRLLTRRLLWRTIFIRTFILCIAGFVVISQALLGWIPSIGRLWQTALSGTWINLWIEIQADFVRLGIRLVRWWAGVAAGGATQDSLVFALWMAILLWVVGISIAWIARSSRRGFLAALPALWLLATMTLYSAIGRWPLLNGLLLAIALHILLDHVRLEQRWQKEQLDYSGDLFMDRALHALGASILLLGLALLLPSISISPLVDRYMTLIAPLDRKVEGMGERLFPDLRATSRFRGSSLAGGLPNSFLLGAGPELGLREVMRVRTDEPFIFLPEGLDEIPPPGHYIRGGTLTLYDGLGWSNPESLARERRKVEAISLADPSLQESLPGGRRLVTQDIFLTFDSQLLYAAPEPIAPTSDFRVEERVEGDLVALWSEPGRNVRSYTIISAVPAVSESDLLQVANWGEDALLPKEYAMHLALPETVTERTRQLAATLTNDLRGPYAKAKAIEQHLRGLTYDLTVSKPPDDVMDVADYFLFDLQRGYCDYYATAFVVLARLAGLPTRFATGFAPGNWNAQDGMRIVTEAEAHSWPEVYFPDYGWIPFEPTAGRSALARVGLSAPSTISGITESAPSESSSIVEDDEIAWNWQMLIWLAPLGLLLWWGIRLYVSWRRRRENPWEGVLRWGAKNGRPLESGETILEYGTNLAEHTLVHIRGQEKRGWFSKGPPDAARIVAREIIEMSKDVTTLLYDHGRQKATANERIAERWRRLRDYLHLVKLHT